MTTEITAWLKNNLDGCTDPVIKKAIKGNANFYSTDYFYQSDSLRLRSAGYKLLNYFFDSETFEHSRPFHSGEILKLSKHLNTPFYINQDKIAIFSNEQIVMCKLAGSVEDWLKNFPKV